MTKATMTEDEFCAAVGISRVTAWRLRRQGKLPHCKVGVKILYRPEHVTQFLEAHEQQSLRLDNNLPLLKTAGSR